jgi:hypothetical protein
MSLRPPPGEGTDMSFRPPLRGQICPFDPAPGKPREPMHNLCTTQARAQPSTKGREFRRRHAKQPSEESRSPLAETAPIQPHSRSLRSRERAIHEALRRLTNSLVEPETDQVTDRHLQQGEGRRERRTHQHTPTTPTRTAPPTTLKAPQRTTPTTGGTSHGNERNPDQKARPTF